MNKTLQSGEGSPNSILVNSPTILASFLDFSSLCTSFLSKGFHHNRSYVHTLISIRCNYFPLLGFTQKTHTFTSKEDPIIWNTWRVVMHDEPASTFHVSKRGM